MCGASKTVWNRSNSDVMLGSTIVLVGSVMGGFGSMVRVWIDATKSCLSIVDNELKETCWFRGSPRNVHWLPS